MRFAEVGFNLEIDLSSGAVDRVETDPKDTEHFLGGLGTNLKILWDRVPPEVGPFSSDNLLIFGTGLLCGTSVPGCNRTIVSTISPETLLTAFSMMGGSFAAELKFAGYDKLIFRGKSPDLVYLWIDNNQVQIRDASHLKGKTTTETAEILRKELKEPDIVVASIGPAGENRCSFASIQCGNASLSSGGVGAVMGDKRIKAIAVRGTNEINVARPPEFIKLIGETLKYIEDRLKNPLEKGVPASCLATLGIQEFRVYDEAWHLGMFAWGHARYRRKDVWNERIEQDYKRAHEQLVERVVSCFNCPVSCAGVITHPKLPHRAVLKCSQHIRYICAAESENPEFGYAISAMGDEYGLDGFTAPLVIAFGLELYKNGILTDADFPGMPSDNEERFYWLLDKIARREGIGDVLANGTYWAARQIGNGAEAFDHNTVKKREQAPLKLSMLNPLYYIMYCTGEKINITQIEGQWPQAALETRQDREEFVKDWIHVPDEKFKEYFLNWEPRSFPFNPTVQACCEIVDWMEAMHYIDDTLGICASLSSFMVKPPYHVHNVPHIISAATGQKVDTLELLTIVKRIRNLARAGNLRRGMTRKDEKPPDDHWKKRFPELEKELLDTYYKFKGWNNEGVPTKEFLHELGLDYVFEDLNMRGLYPEEGPGAVGADHAPDHPAAGADSGQCAQ